MLEIKNLALDSKIIENIKHIRKAGLLKGKTKTLFETENFIL